MPTLSKRPPTPPAKRRAALPPKPVAKPQRFLRFHHSEDLRIKTLAVLTALEQAPDPTKHRVALAELIVELSGVGMDCYFMQPIKLAKPGFFVEQTASLGISGGMKSSGLSFEISLGAWTGLSFFRSLGQFVNSCSNLSITHGSAAGLDSDRRAGLLQLVSFDVTNPNDTERNIRAIRSDRPSDVVLRPAGGRGRTETH